MKALEVASSVLKSKQAALFREIEGGYEVMPLPQVKGPALIACRGWSLLDLFTAQAIAQVHLVLSEAKRVRFESLGLMAMSRVAIHLVVKAERARVQLTKGETA